MGNKCLKLLFVLLLSLSYKVGANMISRENQLKGTLLERVLLSILLGSITGLGCALVCACLVRCILAYFKTIPILKGPVVFTPQISPKSLQSALQNQNQNQMLGNGNGKYYITVLDNNNKYPIAVKKLQQPFDEPNRNSVKRRIQRELEMLAGLRHRHLMSLRAYVHEPHTHTFSLVYDYIPTGSLEDVMKKARENQLQLGWDARLRIAVGIIKALQHLHFACTPKMLHYNLKPSNVLLDADFEPRLTDCGLANLFAGYSSSSSSSTSPYNAPECFPNFSGRYTEKSEMFSFGAILGILLTGREANDALFGEDNDMGMWFRQLLETGDAREALDKTLLGQEMEEDQMLMALRIAAVCLSHVPAHRPSSDELVPMLTQLHSF